VHNLHGLPGIIGGLAGVVMSAVATQAGSSTVFVVGSWVPFICRRDPSLPAILT
jgi:hypothetical protein